MIRFACPGCSSTFTVGDEKAGKTGKCPKCQSQFVIPEAPTDTPPPEPPPLPSAHVAPPPAPPPPAADDPIEIQPCPKCGARLSVLPGDVGKDIECPTCQTVYRARRGDAPPPPDAGERKSSTGGVLVRVGSGNKKDDDDRPSKRRSRRDDDDDDRPSRRRRRSRRDDDDDDDDDRPRRRSRRGSGRGYVEPHRGGMILAFAIIGWVAFWPLTIVAWVMGNGDMQAIDSGRMDPEGRSMTNTGRILGMIGTILGIVGVVVACLIWVLFVAAIGGAAAGAGGGRIR